MQLGLGLGLLGRAFAPVSVAALTEAALAGSGGFALDLSDTSRMWQDIAKTIPVTTGGQSIAVLRSKWGNTEYDFTQGTVGSRPIWNGTNAADFLGTSYHLITATAGALLNNKPAGFGCARILCDTIPSTHPIFNISTITGNSARFRLVANADGSLSLSIRRVDGGTATVATSATGVIVAGVPAVVTMTCDYAGTRAIVVRVNGTQVISTTLTETAGNTSATDSGNFYINRHISALDYGDGRLSRAVFADKLMTAQQLSDIEAWVGQGGLS